VGRGHNAPGTLPLLGQFDLRVCHPPRTAANIAAHA